MRPTGLSPLKRVIVQPAWLVLVVVGAMIEALPAFELAVTEVPGRMDKGGTDPSAQR